MFGKSGGLGASFELSSVNGSNGFKIAGVAAGDYSGISVSAAGDVNGDGFADLIIGADGADPNGAYSGASYLVFGKASGFRALLLSGLTGTNGFKISGEAARVWPPPGRERRWLGRCHHRRALCQSKWRRFGRRLRRVREVFRLSLQLSSLTGANGF